MQLYHVISLVAVIAQASAASSSASHSDLNGWYPCSESTFADEGGSGNQDAECAVYSAPLCYPGICATPKPIDSTVDIFVKRVAAVIDAETATNVWLLQGGPGASSTAMESAMVELHARLDGAVNVYTMDHRGTGRSTLLDCVAAQATTTGSPWGSGIDTAEVPACAQALEKKYGNLSSFSMTSAAMDMATFISDYSNSADTIVYAVSYGTALVERLIHLDPPEYYFLSTNDIYDGDYDESLAALVTGSSSSIAGFVTTVSKENATYKAAFIVFLVLFVATLALAGLFAFRWLKLKRENERNRATGDLPDDIEISTPPEVEATSPELTTAFSTQRSKEAR
ncbi:hypothetical protein PC121_g6299 [Phytophthora cactorum]|nr:hypothetical protein PC121_g6299 [Phytophthora cactorum]